MFIMYISTEKLARMNRNPFSIEVLKASLSFLLPTLDLPTIKISANKMEKNV